MSKIVYDEVKRQRAHIARLTNRILDLEKQLDDALAVADPDNETPDLSLRERIMHIGEQAALMTSVVRTCGNARAEVARLRKRLKIKERG